MPNTEIQLSHSSTEFRPSTGRLSSVDSLRGLIMVLMALDHTRLFFSHVEHDPLDLQHTDAALFFTRWITHLCAPGFLFLAGVGAYLSLALGKRDSRELGHFLWTRGLWLIVLEVTVVRYAWKFNLHYHDTQLLVIWALGCSMILLYGLIRLPHLVIAGIAVALIVGHNMFDEVRPRDWGDWRAVWKLLHARGTVLRGEGWKVSVGYPLIPWVGVMALGYTMGPMFLWSPARRRKMLLILGMVCIVVFVALRASNIYGDPAPWETQKSLLFTVLSFINGTKNPPSLLYLLMTLGPIFIVLALLSRTEDRPLQVLVALGRVPLFFYLLHLPLIHLVAYVIASAEAGHWLVNGSMGALTSDGHGFELWAVYAFWIAFMLVLYPVCRWFAEIKRTHQTPWLSYL